MNMDKAKLKRIEDHLAARAKARELVLHYVFGRDQEEVRRGIEKLEAAEPDTEERVKFIFGVVETGNAQRPAATPEEHDLEDLTDEQLEDKIEEIERAISD
jgi:hypothetical protein